MTLVMVSAVASGAAHARGKRISATVAGPYNLKVDYSKTLEEMVVSGDYDWTGYGGWEKNFMVVGTGMQVFKVSVVKFDRELETPKVLDELWKRNFRAAYLEHLLAFGGAYPEEQGKCSIVALGAPGAEIIGDEREMVEEFDSHGKVHYSLPPVIIDQVVGYLHVNYRGRALDQLPFDGPSREGWSEEYCFLAIKK